MFGLKPLQKLGETVCSTFNNITSRCFIKNNFQRARLKESFKSERGRGLSHIFIAVRKTDCNEFHCNGANGVCYNIHKSLPYITATQGWSALLCYNVTEFTEKCS